MSSRTVINLVLLVLVGALGAVAWLEPGIKHEKTPVMLTALKAAEIRKVRIERASTQSITFEKRNGKWWMAEPLQAPVNEIRMESVLHVAETKSTRQYPAGEVDLVKAGLQQPEVKLTFNDKPPLAFGDTEPLNQQRYVQVGNEVFLIDDIAYYNVVGDYTTFLDTSLLPEDAAIDALSLPGLTLTHGKQGWQAQPTPQKFSADQVNRLMDNWRHAQALQVRPAGTDKPDGAVTLTLAKETKPLRFDIIKQEHELVLRRGDLPLEYHFPPEMAKQLLQLPDDSGAPENSH